MFDGEVLQYLLIDGELKGAVEDFSLPFRVIREPALHLYLFAYITTTCRYRKRSVLQSKVTIALARIKIKDTKAAYRNAIDASQEKMSKEYDFELK